MSAAKQNAPQAAPPDESAVPRQTPASSVAAHPKAAAPKATPAREEQADANAQVSDEQVTASQEPTGALGATANGSYVWAGRYELKDRADAAAKEIRDLGLTALVVSRTGLRRQFFIVLAGPFGAKKAADVKDLLQADGFANAHMFKIPQGAAAQQPGEDETR